MKDFFFMIVFVNVINKDESMLFLWTIKNNNKNQCQEKQ